MLSDEGNKEIQWMSKAEFPTAGEARKAIV